MKLNVDQIARVDFSLKLGAVAETVEVTATAALLESETTTMGQVIEQKRIVEMPLNLRNYLELAKFASGVLPARQLGRAPAPPAKTTPKVALSRWASGPSRPTYC